jgi:thiosulfate reductase cytochrome b subunit
MNKIYIYTWFNRIWHWVQAALIILLMLTGFSIHFDKVNIFDFETATHIHNISALAFIIVTGLSIFWHFTSDQWKNYVPTTKYFGAMLSFYLKGIFKNQPHPFKKSKYSKLNPIQRIVYLKINLIVLPTMVVTGALYYTFNKWPELGFENLQLSVVAAIHAFVALLLVAFLVAHIYLATTGKTPLTYLKAMVTGFETEEKEEK